MRVKTGGWLLASCLVLSGCAATSREPAAPRPDAVHPKVVELSFANGLTATSYFYVADGTVAWLESHEPQNSHDATTPQTVKRTTRTPTAQQWNRFWRTLDWMHPERWKPYYLSADDPDGMTMTDATDWTLTIATTSQTFHSGGDASLTPGTRSARLRCSERQVQTDTWNLPNLGRT